MLFKLQGTIVAVEDWEQGYEKPGHALMSQKANCFLWSMNIVIWYHMNFRVMRS